MGGSEARPWACAGGSSRQIQCQPGLLLPVAGANHFTIFSELRSPAGQLTRLALDLAR